MPTPMIDALGVVHDVPDEHIEARTAMGWKPQTFDDVLAASTAAAREEAYGGVGGGLKAAAAAGLRGATLGLSDVAARALGGEDAAITLEGLRAENPGISFAGELGGALAPSLITGGAGLAKGIGGAVEGLGARAGSLGAERLGAGLARAGARVGELGSEGGALARLGESAVGRAADYAPSALVGALGKGVSGAVGGGFAGAVASGAAEGALYGAGQGVSELALEQDPLTWERAASAIGSNALFGAGAGAALGGTLNVVERGLAKGSSLIDAALEKRALSKAKTPIEAIETGDLERLDPRILDSAEKSELERIRVEQAPQRKAFTDELDTWRRSNREEHDLREVAKGSTDPDLREAGGAFDRANLKLRAALDDRVGFAEDPLKSMKAVRAQGQALEEMKSAALEQQRAWQQEVADAPAQIRSALDQVEALGAGGAPVPRGPIKDISESFDVGGKKLTLTTETKPPVPGGMPRTKVTITRTLGDGEEVVAATAEFTHRTNGLYPEHVNVEPALQRQGVATRMYDAAESISGKRAIPSDNQTPQGKAFREKFKSKSPESQELRGADLLKARKKLAAELGLGNEIGPFTDAGKEAAVERVMKDRMSYHWHGDGGAIRGGLKEPAIVRRISKIDEMIAANQRLQSQLEMLAKPPQSELLDKIAEARSALGAPKEPSVGQAVLGAVGAVAPFAGPVGAAAAAGHRVMGGFKKLISAVAERTGKAVSAVLDTAAKGAGAAGAAAPVLATATLAKLRYGTKKHDKEPETLPELFKARTDEIKQLTAYDETGTPRLRPAVREQIGAKLRPIAALDPVMADRIETALANRIEYLSSIIPRRPDIAGIPTGPDHWQPSDIAMRSWARSAAAAEDPYAVLERAAHGNVTPEDAATMRIVHPEILADFTHRVTSELPGLRQTLPYDRQLSLSILTGIPVAAALDPKILKVLQGQFPAEPGSAGGTQAPKPQPQFGSIKQSVSQPTPAQSRAQGHVA